MTHTIDLVYSTTKGYASLTHLCQYLANKGWSVRLLKIHRNCLRNRKTLKTLSDTVILAYDKPLVRLRKCGWDGQFIYIEHGLSPMKYYTYRYDFFQEAALLFYPGEVFKRKMEAINPQYDRGLLGGYPKIDELVSLKIDKASLCKRFALDPAKPVILFAPSWGGKKNRDAGIHNARYLSSMENVLIVPHSADYPLVKQYGAVRPQDGNINQFLHLADVVISDVSSVLAEAAILNKPVIQLKLPHYPGCFPEKEKRRSGTWVPDQMINEEQQVDRQKRPFKIPYIDEDWIMGAVTEPENLSETIQRVLQHPELHTQDRQYWAEQSCWMADGKSCERITRMIDNYLSHRIIKQIDD
ncbi:MAG: CDP-glycerol glycerophosphotransferase family protein [Candidatus Marinimicrobia bacterium]|nr:CDP-glycerol glycerophosphotransferase family protein [Candidatus Neomarinimicrobiota bacterium]MCF7904363.1 CDP-glycerol glycerophosphotransferase family protein [Candidatus Neomarinimicrobiota bacterium]